MLLMRIVDFVIVVFFFFKQKTAYEMRISDWSSDVCSSDLAVEPGADFLHQGERRLCAGMAAGTPASPTLAADLRIGLQDDPDVLDPDQSRTFEIGRASCRERVCKYV